MPNLCRAALEHHRLLSLLPTVLTTSQLGLEKRNPALYHRAAELCGQRPCDCVLFDDSPVYCAAAREAGWQVFGVADPVFADRAEEMARICGPGRFPFDFTGPLPVYPPAQGIPFDFGQGCRSPFALPRRVSLRFFYPSAFHNLRAAPYGAALCPYS